MRKRDALRLKPGDVVGYANHMVTEKATAWGEGRVLHVTPKGGIRVEPLSSKNFTHDWRTERGVAAPRWVPYHHIIEYMEN